MYTSSSAVRSLFRTIQVHAISRSLAFVILAAGVSSPVARAAVVAIDDVWIDRNGMLIADDPFTEALEGLAAYPTGNGINLNDPTNAQTRWELNADIIVGLDQPFGGRLDIDGNSKLRFQDLIVGSRDDTTGITGNGRVLITGLQALYSNNPNSLPPGLPANFGVAPGFARAPDVGFDLIIGEWGVGTMEIRGGGRADIQDAVVLGAEPGSSGDLVIDGFASLLASGGFDAGGGPTDTDPHQLIVGQRGFGRMTIRNGGLAITEAPMSAGTTDIIVGAMIGADLPLSDEPPELGGTGIVTVNGLTSKWVIGGSLQIGGFHDSVQAAASDFDGDNVEYATDSGTGTLYVQDGGVVQIRPRVGVVSTDEDLVLAIGRFGELNLSGGIVLMGAGTDDGGLEDNTQVLNDGVITGSGRIETGVFVNRFLGEVRVNPAQSLVIEASAEIITALDNPPLSNFGNIQVLGSGDLYAELEFERAPAVPLEPLQPFLNLRVERPAAAAPGDFYGGLISAQHSRLRFRSGILNSGMIAFTAGENYVTGNVINIPDPNFPAEVGIVLVQGIGTKVVFENDFLPGLGVLVQDPGTEIIVLADHTFITAGDLRINLNPNNPSLISTAGDVGIAGKLTVNFAAGFAPSSLTLGQSFPIISFAGDIGGVDLTNPLQPMVDFDVPPLFSEIQVPNLALFGLPADWVLIPQFAPGNVFLTIRSLLGFVGPDFNGDGVVDFLDLDIWKMNKGIASGATVLQGDANGDGAVNGADYLIWFDQRGGPPMPPGAGGGAGSGSVPEPANFVMLSMAGMLALAFARRRA